MKVVTMLDTIAINLQRNDYEIKHPERFHPHAGALTNPLFGDGGIVKCYYNPTNKEKAQGYMPRLTIYKKPFGDWAHAVWMRVEFSAPKLIFGNNFEELAGSSDFLLVAETLLKALERMGIKTTLETIMTARVTAIHYSKNILLDRDTPCHMLIQTLEKADINGRLDVNQTDFRNGGQMAKYHASTFEIVLYDKVKDLQQAIKFSEKRGTEIDYDCQADLFTGDKVLPEVLRFEIRLQTRKLKSLLKTLGIERDMTFKSLFCANLSRNILLHYWEAITKGLYIINIDTSHSEKLIDNVRTQFPKKRINTVLALMGFVRVCQDVGVRGARVMLRLNNSQYYRFKSDAQKLKQDYQCSRFRALGTIKAQLIDFIPLIRGDIVDEALILTNP